MYLVFIRYVFFLLLNKIFIFYLIFCSFFPSICCAVASCLTHSHRLGCTDIHFTRTQMDKIYCKSIYLYIHTHLYMMLLSFVSRKTIFLHIPLFFMCVVVRASVMASTSTVAAVRTPFHNPSHE